MSYLELPRLCFFGTFKAAPSTINNTDDNYDTSVPVTPANLLWNPTGLAEFQILQGSEITIPPGAAVVPTTVQSLQTSAGFITSGDPLIGQFVISTNQPSTGKLVDLDPDQQFVSQVWGMQIAIGAPGGEQVVGNFTAAYFQQIFFGRNVSFGAAGSASAAYQSLLTNLRWPASITSPFLQQLQAASPDVLSIRFTVDIIDLSSRSLNGTPNPNFTLGRVTGAIGPATLNDPTFLNPRGRMLRPPATASAAAVSAPAPQDIAAQIRQSEDAVAVLKADPLAENTVLATAAGAAPAPPTFNYAPAIFDQSRNTIVVDLANSLQFNAAGPLTTGTLTAVLQAGSGPIALGPIANTLGNYQQGAFLFEFPLTTPAAIAAASSSPIVVQWNGTTVLAENANGAYVDATDHVVRLDANTTTPTTLSLFATTFGGPVAAGQQVTLGPAVAFADGSVPDGVVQITPNPVPLTGAATFTISAGNPNFQRLPIDGQVYLVPISWSQDSNPDTNASVSVLVWDPLADSSPTWANVQPIFEQFMHLYPGMQSILNLADQATVEANASLIAGYLSAPVTSSRYMPVTRDLSDVKKQMIIAYLNSI